MVKKRENVDVIKILLKTLEITTVLSMAVMAPNALQALDMFYGNKAYDRSKKRYYINTTITKLKEKGFIKFENKSGKKFVRLTKKGREKLLKYQLQEIKIKKPKRWDKKWRVVIFDIKEQRKYAREGLRIELIRLGFLKLQNSVWVYPYDCEEVIVMIKSHLKIGKDILYMTVEKIENDRWLKKEFGLK